MPLRSCRYTSLHRTSTYQEMVEFVTLHYDQQLNRQFFFWRKYYRSWFCWWTGSDVQPFDGVCCEQYFARGIMIAYKGENKNIRFDLYWCVKILHNVKSIPVTHTSSRRLDPAAFDWLVFGGAGANPFGGDIGLLEPFFVFFAAELCCCYIRMKRKKKW